VLLRAVKDLGEFEKRHANAPSDVRRGSPDPAALDNVRRGSPDPAALDNVRRGSPDPAARDHVRRGSPDPAAPNVRRSSPDPAALDAQLLLSVYELLCRWRSRAETAGHFPPSTDVRQLIADPVHALLGPFASSVVGTLRVPSSTLSVVGTLRVPSPGANISPDVSPLEPARIASTADESTTSGDALTPANKKIPSQC
jgi:hypothetical protein